MNFPLNPAEYSPRFHSDYTRRASTYRHEQSAIEHREAAMSHRANSADYSSSKPFTRRPMLALLISAHNEELVLANTVRSAIRAGMQRQHIYIVDDCSTDSTAQIARGLVGANNTITVAKSGKGLALSKAAKHFQLSRRYRWIHIADADGGFAPDYFTTFRRELRVRNAAATGYIKSLPGGPVSQYRVFEYTIGMEIHRRFQAMTNTVTVIPGPTSCFRADIFSKVNFANHSLTEDFDVTLQIHRKGLGRIQWIPKAVAYTQDPKTVRDFVKQITRWNRGVMQGLRHHNVGLRWNRLDAYLSYQVMTNMMFFFAYFVMLPALAVMTQSLAVIAVTFLYDVLVTFCMAVAVAGHTNRWDIMAAFPHIYVFRWLSVATFFRAFVEVIILGKHQSASGGWKQVKRYQQTLPV